MIRSRGRARGPERTDATDRRGRGVSESGRADQLGPAAGAQVRGEREERSDLHQRAKIRSTLIKPKPLDLGWMPEIQRPGAEHERGGAARSRGERSPKTRGWPLQGFRGLGKGSGTFRATRQTRPWAQNRHEGARERRPWWEKSRGGATNSGEQLHRLLGDTWRNKGMGRVLTSSVNSGMLGERWRCDGASGLRPRVYGRGAPAA
jgi:hypothetical protein